ncbi:tRNA1(Val) (adenine(37)-N6)-methyltransferase [[Clostridium] colinum]|uniref:tRNA1(Val) (adenine(37)-N6)-methyltransferase n=1 Tax=[Clostridium] colinum TaxID=36835 RepID=UPI00202543D3|nr:tRNA1(Val) (adenine(37)-N6)-methyltransferase [[Clostridium] colinum]
MDILKENERIDDLHRNNYVIIQDYKKFCFGIDAVLLSDFAKAKKGDIVFDIGTGTGIIPILMSAKTNAYKYFAIDIQEESVDMAKRSVKLNNLTEKIEIFHLDIKNVFEKFKKNSIDVVTSNPPYMNKGGGIVNEYDAKSIARHEIHCNLDDIVKATSFLLKPNGKFYMVHRPSRLCDIICTLRKYNLEPKTIRLIQPYQDKEPNMVLIESVKNGKALLKVLPNLIVYNKNREYTDEINRIYYN